MLLTSLSDFLEQTPGAFLISLIRVTNLYFSVLSTHGYQYAKTELMNDV